LAASDQDILKVIENLSKQKLVEQASLSSMRLPKSSAGGATMKGFRVFVKIKSGKVYDIPQGGRATRGRAIVNLIGCDPSERIEAFVSVNEFDDNHFIVMATKKGVIKKTVLSAYGKPRKGGIYAIEIRDDDQLIEARITNGDHDILIGTSEGKSIRFSETNVRPSGRKTMGVRGIRLSSKDDFVVGMLVVKREGTILVAT
jgi:DNA gyrase subunit A